MLPCLVLIFVDYIGLRTRPVTDAEPDFNLLHGNGRQREVSAESVKWRGADAG